MTVLVLTLLTSVAFADGGCGDGNDQGLDCRGDGGGYSDTPVISTQTEAVAKASPFKSCSISVCKSWPASLLKRSPRASLYIMGSRDNGLRNHVLKHLWISEKSKASAVVEINREISASCATGPTITEADLEFSKLSSCLPRL